MPQRPIPPDKLPSKGVEAAKNRLLAQTYRATDALVAEMDRRFTAAISADVWKWPHGESPRDIVDTGALRASQSYSRLKDGTYQFRWSVPYATSVHEGGTFFDGSEMPARPWTRMALKQLREDGTVDRLMQAEIRKPENTGLGGTP